MAELISVIVATYNREDALDAVLRGLARQRDRHFEVLVADDGSGSATAQVVAQWRGRAAFPLGFHSVAEAQEPMVSEWHDRVGTPGLRRNDPERIKSSSHLYFSHVHYQKN